MGVANLNTGPRLGATGGAELQGFKFAQSGK